MNMKFYRCTKCGKMIAMLKASACPTMCCNQAMELMTPGTTDGAVEKHVPVITTREGLVEVNVGSVSHPMEEKHYIDFIALETDQGTHVKFLNPGEKPQAVFSVVDGNQVHEAYAHCNLHGLWSSK